MDYLPCCVSSYSAVALKISKHAEPCLQVHIYLFTPTVLQPSLIQHSVGSDVPSLLGFPSLQPKSSQIKGDSVMPTLGVTDFSASLILCNCVKVTERRGMLAVKDKRCKPIETNIGTSF